jgi:hypothetical protein
MKSRSISLITAGIFCALMADTSMAGGRYANPPTGLVECFNLCSKGLEAAQKGEKDVALENAKQARKISLNSYKEISTMPMEIASSSMKKALASLDADKVAESVPDFEHCVKKLTEEINYYKKEGKL